MDHSLTYAAHTGAIEALFKDTFTASEGAEEGGRIERLAHELMSQTPDEDLRVVTTWDRGALIACIMFTRMTYTNSSDVFLLSPVAVSTAHQRRGVGQAILRFGLNALREEGATAVVTYGDPAYYAKVGFQPVSVYEVPAPHTLQYPHGWQAQSLSTAPLPVLQGPVRTVAAFDDPSLW